MTDERAHQRPGAGTPAPAARSSLRSPLLTRRRVVDLARTSTATCPPSPR